MQKSGAYKICRYACVIRHGNRFLMPWSWRWRWCIPVMTMKS